VDEHPQGNRPGTRRLTVSEAAEILGISTGAVRNRITRGTLEAEHEGGRVFVVLPAGIPEDTRRDADVEYLKAHIETLQAALEAERESNRENRRLLAAALERIPPQLEAPSEPREAPETATEEAERPATGGVQEGAQRPWWRRWFGG
jgi:hypothetical protein